jgi:hypothetical protein
VFDDLPCRNRHTQRCLHYLRSACQPTATGTASSIQHQVMVMLSNTEKFSFRSLAHLSFISFLRCSAFQKKCSSSTASRQPLSNRYFSLASHSNLTASVGAGDYGDYTPDEHKSEVSCSPTYFATTILLYTPRAKHISCVHLRSYSDGRRFFFIHRYSLRAKDTGKLRSVT